jgi:hypothetical protein
LLAISGLVFGQAVSNPGQPTSTPNQINVTNSYLYLNKMHYAGGWVGTTPYNAQDVVTYSGSSYVSLQAGNLGQSPATAFTYWAALGGGSGAVASVFGRTGVVAAAANDYSTSLVGEGSNLYFTAARAVAAMAGLYQGPITTGSTAQYFRGDLSLATFPTNLSSFTNGPGYLTANAVTSVFGRTGAVAAAANDYSFAQLSGAAVAAQVPANVRARAVGWSFSGGGSALTAQTSGAAAATFACTISAWTLTVDTGTATIDVWKIATGTAIPTVANTITASAVPAIASGTALRSTTLTGWTTSVAANDILVFKLSAVASATLATLVLECDQ